MSYEDQKNASVPKAAEEMTLISNLRTADIASEQSTIDSLRRSLSQREHDHRYALRALDAVQVERDKLRRELMATTKALETRRKFPFPAFQFGKLIVTTATQSQRAPRFDRCSGATNENRSFSGWTIILKRTRTGLNAALVIGWLKPKEEEF